MADEIIMIGLNPSAIHEAAALRSQGNKVLFIGNGSTPDSVSLGKKKYPLSSSANVDDFTKQLGLSPQQEIKLATFIKSLGDNIKDEMGHFAVILSQMEKANKGPNRLVLSGHSIGNYFWGERNGTLMLRDMKTLSSIFPKAVSLFEDLHLSACYSGNELDIAAWRDVFPNISTIWAYSGSAPGSYAGAVKHLSIWSKATKGNKTVLDRGIADNTRKGKNVAVWSKQFGYQSKESTAIGDLMNRITGAERTYQAYFSGESIVLSPQSGPLRDYYNDIQELIGHPLATPAQLNRYESRINVVIRLLYFDKSVKKHFAETYATQLDKAYAEIGLPKPDFSKLSRKACLAEITTYGQKASGHTSVTVIKAKDLLTNGLRDLEKTYIPEYWI